MKVYECKELLLNNMNFLISKREYNIFTAIPSEPSEQERHSVTIKHKTQYNSLRFKIDFADKAITIAIYDKDHVLERTDTWTYRKGFHMCVFKKDPDFPRMKLYKNDNNKIFLEIYEVMRDFFELHATIH